MRKKLSAFADAYRDVFCHLGSSNPRSDSSVMRISKLAMGYFEGFETFIKRRKPQNNPLARRNIYLQRFI